MGYKWWVVVAVILFTGGVIAGLFTPTDAPYPNSIINTLQRMSGNVIPFSLTTAVFIFFKNLISLVFSFIFSPFLLLAPLFTLLVNSWMLGFVSVAVTSKVSLIYVLKGLLPHGIFEIPAIILGEAAAFYFGSVLLIALFWPQRRYLLGSQIKQSAKFLLIAGILLIPAALIETYFTPFLLGK
jgi:stage II sporulation protein M